MGRTRPETHRVWFETWGFLPDAFICHHCDNPRCIDPNHLFLGSNSDNLLDCVDKGRHGNARKTHCSKGHEYTSENTYVRTSRGWTERMCRVCIRAYVKAAKSKRAGI